MLDINYNYEMFSLSFQSSCLNLHHQDVLSAYDSANYGGITKVYIPTATLSTFVLEFDDTTVFNECLMDLDYDLILNVEVECYTETTNNIWLNSTLKPNAWHLDQLNLNKDFIYHYVKQEKYDNVDLWILDTGVNKNHKDFEIDQVIDEDVNFNIFNITHPHGTGTADAAAGIFYGSSKHTIIHNWPVCRSGGSCASSDVDKGLKKVLEVAKKNWLIRKRTVINMSLGNNLAIDPTTTSLGQYFNGLFKEISENGGIIVVAAGNSNQDACTWLYSFSPYVISVGSIDRNYNKSVFSNWGNCVDIWTFGTDIPLAYSVSDPNVIQYKSGTSFAAPLLSGLIVNLLNNNPYLTKDQILNILWHKENNYTTASYTCGKENKQCCKSDIIGSRLDNYCRSLTLLTCEKSCAIGPC